MKKINLLLLITIALASVSLSAIAHDPKLHVKKPEKANCKALIEMNKNKKADKTDPVMIAMMKKCENQANKMDHDNDVDVIDDAKTMDNKMKKHHMKKQKSDKSDDHQNH